MTASRPSRLLLALLPVATACQGAPETHDQDPLDSMSSALVLCSEPPMGVAKLCDLGNGQVKFLVTLELGQQYVELFVRQNGIQNVALDITRTAHVHYNGWATYAATLNGYQDGDHIEYRFYSYLPGKPGVFTPGPQENVWLTHDYAADTKVDLAVIKDASLIYSSYGTGPSFDRNFGSAPTVDVAGYHHDSRGLFGYDIAGLDDSMLIKKAELVIPAMWAAGGDFGSFTLSKVDPGASWQEHTVTWMTTPPATLFGEFTVNASVENRLDVTNLVSDAVAAGETELSVLLEDIQNNLFIDSKEKVGGKPTFLHVEYADVDWSSLVRTWHVDAGGSGGPLTMLVPLETPVGPGFADELTFEANGTFLRKTIATNGQIATFAGNWTRTGNKLVASFYEVFRKKTWRWEYQIEELTPSLVRLETLHFSIE